jgi:hypothetical protein
MILFHLTNEVVSCVDADVATLVQMDGSILITAKLAFQALSPIGLIGLAKDNQVSTSPLPFPEDFSLGRCSSITLDQNNYIGFISCFGISKATNLSR